MKFKRLFDFVFSSLGLIVLAPAFILITLLIKIDSKGSIFFRQERVGKDGKTFYIHKFRTMISDVERRGLQITVGTDARVTKIGKFLRKYKIDELPQLIDVWLGSMSLVGPRPEVPKYVAYYPDSIKNLVLSVKPGITDKASIEFKDENEILGQSDDPERAYIEVVLPIKLKYYVEYVENNSMIGDISIIFKTFKAIIR